MDNNQINQQENTVQEQDNASTSTTTSPTSSQQSFTPIASKKSKLPTIIIAILLLVIAAGAGWYFLLRDKKDTPSTNNNQPISESDKKPSLSAVAQQIDALMAAGKQTSTDIVEQGSVYASVGETGNFGNLANTKAQNVYIVGPSTSDGSCDSADITKLVADIKTIFDKANYKNTEHKAYSGGFGCGDVILARKESELCSVSFFEADMKDGKYKTLVSVGCYPATELAKDIERLNEIKQLKEDTGNKVGDEIYAEVETFRNSESGNYKIAVLTTPMGSAYYYKKLNGKWLETATNNDGYISCVQTGANKVEVMEAFKGETCDSYNSGKKL